MKVAFSFEHFYFTWHGGVNYFRNLFNALALAGGVDVTLFGGVKQEAELRKRFPAQQMVITSMLDRGSVSWFVRSVIKKVLGRDVLLERLLLKHGIQVMSHSIPLGRGSRIPCAAWIPDFQHLHLPHLCTADELERRNTGMKFLCEQADMVFVSSQSAADDLARFSPSSAGKIAVLRFSIPPLDDGLIVPKEQLLKKYDLEERFFYVPNQFWAHKNHMLVVQALRKLKSGGEVVPMVVFSGAMEDYRKESYSATVLDAVKNAELTDRVRFLGVVPYQDVMSLMMHCHVLINPSQFEGWSTPVEEAKTLGKRMLLSSLPVHIEQAAEIADFFDPDDFQTLAALLRDEYAQRSMVISNPSDANSRFMAFGSCCKDALTRLQNSYGQIGQG